MTTSEGTGSGGGPSKTGGDNLRTAITMLPTPRATRGGSSTETTYLLEGEDTKARLAEPEGHSPLLPTPTVGMTQGENKTKSAARSGELLLNGSVETFTPLPNPRASEGEKGSPKMRGSTGDLMLSSAVHRLTGESTSQLFVAGKPCEEPPLPLSS